MLNQGIFAKLVLGEDGSVDYADVREPFASIMAIDPDTTVTTVPGRAKAVVDRLLDEARALPDL